MIRAEDGRFYHGIILTRGRRELVGPSLALGEKEVSGTPSSPIFSELRRGGWGRWRYCDDCYRNVLPYALVETSEALGITDTCVCSECGYGIDQREEESETLASIRADWAGGAR